MKYVITCFEERKNGKLILPQIQCVITAESIEEAKRYAWETYSKYNKISVYQWCKSNGNV